MTNWLPRKSVVVPIDFSDDSFAAAELALAMVEQGSNLHVIHVMPHLSPEEPGIIWDSIDNESRIQHAKQAMRERLSDAKFESIEAAAAFGDPGREIAQYAERTKADLIVLPSHGRTGLKRILLGSVAERVIALAHCPVLVLRK